MSMIEREGPTDDGPPTAVIPMVLMPRELAERCVILARGILRSDDRRPNTVEWKREAAAVLSDLQDPLARE